MRYLIVTIVVLSFFYLLGCSDDPDFDTESGRINLSEGWSAYNQGNFSAALLSFERAINLDANLADAHNGLGWSHLSASRVSSVNPQIITKAQHAFEEAIRLDSANADAWIGLSNTLFLRREGPSDFQTALRAIDNALKADQSSLFRHDYHSAADLHALTASCYYYLGRHDLVAASIDQAIKINPNHPTALSLRQISQTSQ